MIVMLVFVTEVVPTDPPTTTESSAVAAAEAEAAQPTTPANGNHIHLHSRIHEICVRLDTEAFYFKILQFIADSIMMSMMRQVFVKVFVYCGNGG